MLNGKPRVLLTASYGPNELAWGEDMYDMMTSRLARGHGPFQLTSHCHYFGLYLIAENLSNPVTVLENPHWDEFDRELDQGYDVVGFQLKSVQTPKIARMMRRIREKSPGTKIVVGGYGVSTLGTPVPGDTEGHASYIRDEANYLCREEGVRFMRRVLDDGPEEREITQYTLPTAGFSVEGVSTQVRVPMVLVALGCPNACDFCNTSAFFNYKKTYVAEPEQVYRFVKNYQKRLGTDALMFMIFDEDFFMNPDYVRELGRLLRSDKKTWGVRYSTFGGIRSLSQFDPEELRDCGLGSVWIGVESFICGAERTDERYAKRKGKEVNEVFEALHRNGIETIGSLIMGFDFHTPENLKQDIDQFVALRPIGYQLSPLTPCPGTALYDRMLEEGRIVDSYEWGDFHLWKDDVFELKNFKPGEIKELYDYAHEQIRDKNGPQTLQLLENALNAYQSLKGRPGEFHAFQAERAKERATGMSAMLRAVKQHHHSPTVRARAQMLERRFRDEIGSSPLLVKMASRYLSRRIGQNAKMPNPPVVSDPPPRWSYYRTFDDRVWVRKGRKASTPIPYTDRQSRLFSMVRFIRGRD